MRRRSAWLASASIVVLGVAYFAFGLFGRGRAHDESAPSGAIAAAGASLADGAALDRDLAVEAPDQAGRAAVPVADAPAVPAMSEHAPADAGTLLVQTVDKLSRAPLAGVRLDVSRKEVDESAAPGEDALGSKGDLAHRPLTDSDGRAELSIPSGVDLELWAYVVDGRCEMRNVDVTPLRPSERRDLVVELATGDDLHVFGKVVDDGGAAIAGARVLVVRAEPSNALEPDPRIGRARAILSRTTTSTEGEFELRMPSWKQAFVRVEAEGFAFATLRRCDGHDSRDRPLEVRLARSATLEARVVDPAGGAVPDVAVRLLAKGYTLLPRSTSAAGGYVDVPDEQWLASTGSDGRCTLRDLCPDVPMAIELLRGERLLWREPEPLVFVRGQVLEREWTVGGGCALRGVVLDQNSKPVPGLELWLLKANVPQPRYFRPHEEDQVSVRTTTDADGRFLIASVEPGTWWIGPAATGRGSTIDASGSSVRDAPSPGEIAPAATRVELPPAGTQDVTLRVFRGLFIRGKVLDPDGRGLRGAWVTASPARSPWGSICDTDRDGAFVAGPLAEGAFTLVAESTDRFPESEPVEARTGDTGVVLRLRAGGGIRALVVDSRTGKPCAAELILAPHLAGGGNIDDGIGWGVDEKGVVDWQGLLPGSYDLAAKTEDGCFGVLVGIGVVAGEKGKELVLSVAPGGTLRMSYDGPDPYVSFDYLVDGARVDWGGQVVRGQPLERAAPAGNITIEIHAIDDGAPTRKRVVHLNAGEVKEIRLEADD